MGKRDAFSMRHPGIIGERKFRQYGVLIPMVRISGVTYLVFEKRSGNLRHQPGEICFPGGKLEPGETLQECAVRETVEELKVSPDQIEVLGPGDIYVSPFNLMIHPFIGFIRDYEDTFSTDEVAEIIKIPLSYFFSQSPEKYVSRLVSQPQEDFPYDWIPGGEKYPWVKGTYDILFYRYEGWILWGMTALMAKSAVNLISEYDLDSEPDQNF